MDAPSASETFASNPPNTRASFLRYGRCYPGTAFFWGLACAFITVVAFLSTFWWLIASVLFAWMQFVTWLNVRRKLREGDLCPAVIVSDKPWTIACCTDLGFDGEEFVAVKIVRQPLGRVVGPSPKVGDYLPAVAFYYAGGVRSYAAWDDFSPIPVGAASNDAAEVQRCLDAIPQEQLLQLEQLLGRLPEWKPGLYKMWLDVQPHYRPAPEESLKKKIGSVVLAILLLGMVGTVAFGWFMQKGR